MGEAPGGVTEADIRFLRRLVAALSVTMIAGLLAIVTLLVIRLGPGPADPVLPEALRLPDGATAAAFTRGRGWIAVVTDDDRILIYDPATGALRQTLTIGQ
jgi:hypothetical protein